MTDQNSEHDTYTAKPGMIEVASGNPRNKSKCELEINLDANCYLESPDAKALDSEYWKNRIIMPLMRAIRFGVFGEHYHHHIRPPVLHYPTFLTVKLFQQSHGICLLSRNM